MATSNFSRTKERVTYQYTENCRLMYSKIGKQIRKSPQYSRNLIQNLEEEKTIIPYTLVDYSHLGQLAFKVYFKGGFTKESELNKLLNYISKDKAVASVQSVSGPYDIVVEFLSNNPSRFNKDIKELIKEKRELMNYDIAVNVVSHYFPKKYLTRESQNIKDYIIGGDRQEITLAENEKNVLKELVNNPRENITKIADNCGINIRTALSIKKTLEKNIIKGYKAEINVQNIGFIRNRITLKLHNTSPELEKTLLKKCISDPQVVQFSKTLGAWDIEIDVETKDMQKFRKVYLELREEFKEIIQSFNYFNMLDIYKKTMVSENYFEV